MKLSSVTILFAAAKRAAARRLQDTHSAQSLSRRSHHDWRRRRLGTSASVQGTSETRYCDRTRSHAEAQWRLAGFMSPRLSTSPPLHAGLPRVFRRSDPSATKPRPRRCSRLRQGAARATGVYNSSTGKIEWQNGGYLVMPHARPRRPALVVAITPASGSWRGPPQHEKGHEKESGDSHNSLTQQIDPCTARRYLSVHSGALRRFGTADFMRMTSHRLRPPQVHAATAG